MIYDICVLPDLHLEAGQFHLEHRVGKCRGDVHVRHSFDETDERKGAEGPSHHGAALDEVECPRPGAQRAGHEDQVAHDGGVREGGQPPQLLDVHPRGLRGGAAPRESFTAKFSSFPCTAAGPNGPCNT